MFYKQLLFFLFIIIFCFQTIYAQIPLSNSIFDFYADNYLCAQSLGMGGIGIADNSAHLSGAILNPASLSFTQPELIIEYAFKNNFTFYSLAEDIGLNSVKPIYLVGTGFSFKPDFLFNTSIIRCGILFGTIRSFQCDYGTLSIYDSQQLYLGTSQFYSDQTIYSVIFPLCLELNNNLKMGVNVNYMHFINHVSLKGIQNTDIEDLNTQKIVLKYGFFYSPFAWLQFGATLEPGYSLEPSTNIPAKFAVGISSQWEGITWSLDGHYTVCHTDDLKDAFNIYSGIQFPLTSYLTIRLGAFTQLDIRTDTFREKISLLNPNAAYLDHKVFLTNGISLLISDLTIDIAYADSVPISHGATKQRYINMGVGLRF